MNTDKYRRLFEIATCLVKNLFLFICVHLCSSVAFSDVTLSAVGDVLLDRGVAKQIRASSTNYPFQFAAPLLKNADITFGNLECPLAERGQKVPKQVSFKADPAFAPCLNAAGFDILSIANNHTLDCGRTGLQETMAKLRARNIKWCGAGHDRSQAETVTILNVRGLRVGFIGFCEFVPEGVFLNGDKPCIALADDDRVRAALQKARGRCDVLVASFHWGIEYSDRPSERQKHLARLAAQAGADLVLGHHPHVLQGVEVLPGKHGRRCIVAYSLGNFLFDVPEHVVKATADTVVFNCTLDKRGVRTVQLVPMKIEKARPRAVSATEAKGALQTLKKLCAELGTKLEKGRVKF
jgi:poly-gamma-glutamate synthesis protein (capsule biosynthesis protein)